MSTTDIGFRRPGLPELNRRAAEELTRAVPGSETSLRWSNLGVLATVVAGAAHEMHGHLEAVAAAFLPDRATGMMLDRHAIWRGLERLPAQVAGGDVRFTGATPASLLPAGARLSAPDRQVYEVLAPGGIALADGTLTAPVRALLPGPAGNQTAGVRLALQTPLAGLPAAGEAGPQGLTGGADEEEDEALRQRLGDHIRQPPQGGAAHDYVGWALRVPGVTRAWAMPRRRGTGMVLVHFMMDDTYGDGLPRPGDIAAVQAVLDREAPLGAVPVAKAPAALPVTVTVRDLLPATPANRAAVAAELKDLFRYTTMPGQRLPLSHIREAVSRATGEYDHRLDAPLTDLLPTAEQIPVLQEVTWVTS
jgi:uncharacterized phage protein gp47/JayE